jgi:hypothetical protein
MLVPSPSMRRGEAEVQWQQHQALQTMCSRSTRTGQDDSMLGRKGQHRQWEMDVRSNVPPWFGVGQLTNREGNCLGRVIRRARRWRVSVSLSGRLGAGDLGVPEERALRSQPTAKARKTRSD